MVVIKATEVDVVVGGGRSSYGPYGGRASRSGYGAMLKGGWGQFMDEQIVIMDLWNKKDSETHVVERRDSDIQVGRGQRIWKYCNKRFWKHKSWNKMIW